MLLVSEADRIRLAKLLGMLGSSFDGEALNAGRMANELVRGLGLTWHDVLTPPAHKRPNPPPPPPGWRAVVEAALQHSDLLTAWEAKFLRSLRKSSRRLSHKQLAVLDKITEKLRDAFAGEFA